MRRLDCRPLTAAAFAPFGQLIIPLGAHRFIIVVAPGGETPDWQNVAAFLTTPGQCICLHHNFWHHGLIALADGDRFAVIEGGDYRLDTKEISATEYIELHLPD